MADNYLEKRYEEVFGRGASSARAGISRPGLDSLMAKAHSVEAIDRSYPVNGIQLDLVLSVLGHLPAGVDASLYDIRPENGPDGAFIRVWPSGTKNPKPADPGLGIILCSMILKAAEIGLVGMLEETGSGPDAPLAILSIGKASR